jgi:hypothetical protein
MEYDLGSSKFFEIPFSEHERIYNYPYFKDLDEWW